MALRSELLSETEAGSGGTQPGQGIAEPTVRRWTPRTPADATSCRGSSFFGRFWLGRCAVQTSVKSLVLPLYSARCLFPPSNTARHASENPIWHDANDLGMEA